VFRTGDGAPDTTGWRVRVVPNLYPIVGGEDAGEGATGAHEVIVLSPDHDADFARLSEEGAVEVLGVMRERARVHLDAGRAHVQLLINQGRAAGASIEHPHAQLVAIDFVPPAVEAALARFDAAGTDLVAEEAARAMKDGLVVVQGPAPAWSPWAAGAKYMLRVAHRSTRARFDEATDPEVAVVARGLRQALQRLHARLGEELAYNVVVNTAAPGRHPGPFHWWIDVVPRLSVLAGFEAGTGVLVNTVPPEIAAKELREASA
jgi:UDPglucose--hexose-1-phosphate uridylyltransferase